MQVKASGPELATSASSCLCTALKEHMERPAVHPLGLAEKMFCKIDSYVFSHYLLKRQRVIQLLPLQCSTHWE